MSHRKTRTKLKLAIEDDEEDSDSGVVINADSDDEDTSNDSTALCPHIVKTLVQLNHDANPSNVNDANHSRPFQLITDPSLWGCGNCGHTGGVWACLTCGTFGCDDSVHGHAKEHAQNPLGLAVSAATRTRAKAQQTGSPPVEGSDQHCVAVDVNKARFQCFACEAKFSVATLRDLLPLATAPKTPTRAMRRTNSDVSSAKPDLQLARDALEALLAALRRELTQRTAAGRSTPVLTQSPAPTVSTPPISQSSTQETDDASSGRTLRRTRSQTKSPGKPLDLRQSSIFSRDIASFESRDELLTIVKQLKFDSVSRVIGAWRGVVRDAKAAKPSTKALPKGVTALAIPATTTSTSAHSPRLLGESVGLTMASPAVLIAPPPIASPLSVSRLDIVNLSIGSPARHFNHVGLRNLGNSCYMNSVVQSIFNSPRVREYFLSYEFLAQFADSWHKNLVEEERKAASSGEGLKGRGRGKAQDFPSPQVTLRASSILPRKDTMALFQEVTSKRDHKQILLSRELHYLFRVISAGRWAVVTPQALLGNLWLAVPEFRNHRQQDAEELLTHLLDRLDKELHRLTTTPPLKPDAPGTAPAPKKPSQLPVPSSVIGDLFQGAFASVVTCRRCNKVSVTHQPFYDVMLDVPGTKVTYSSRSRLRTQTLAKGKSGATEKEKNCEITELLDGFVAVDEITEYACNNCKQKTTAEQRITFSRLPNVLVLVVKRFGWQKSGQKIDTPVDFPLKGLDMTPYTLGHICPQAIKPQSPAASSPTPVPSPAPATTVVTGRNSLRAATASLAKDDAHSASPPPAAAPQQPTSLYNLTSVVVHQGARLTAGHYFSYCLDKGQVWVLYNDARVRVVDESEVQRAESYLLFYERCSPKVVGAATIIFDPMAPQPSSDVPVTRSTPLPSQIPLHQPQLDLTYEAEQDDDDDDHASIDADDDPMEEEDVFNEKPAARRTRSSERLVRSDTVKMEPKEQASLKVPEPAKPTPQSEKQNAKKRGSAAIGKAVAPEEDEEEQSDVFEEEEEEKPKPAPTKAKRGAKRQKVREEPAVEEVEEAEVPAPTRRATRSQAPNGGIQRGNSVWKEIRKMGIQ